MALRRNESAGRRVEAARMGRSKMEGEPYPRLIFWSAENRFGPHGGKRPKLPPMRHPRTGETRRQHHLALSGA